MGLSDRDESTDMHHDMFGSGHDLDLSSKFQLVFLGYVIYHSMRLDERNVMVI